MRLHVNVLAKGTGAGVAGGEKQIGALQAPGERPSQGVLPPAASDDENTHVFGLKKAYYRTAKDEVRSKVANNPRDLKRLFTTTLPKAVLAGIVLAGLAYVVDIEQIVASAEMARSGWIVGAMMLLPLNVVLEVCAWHVLVRHEIPDARWRVSCASVLAGHALGLLTPARAGELAGRAFSLSGTTPTRLMVLTVVHRLAAMAVGVGLGLGGFLLFLTRTTALPAVPGWLIAASGALVVGGLLAVLLNTTSTLRWLRRLVPFTRWKTMLASLPTLPARRIVRVLGFGLLRYGVYVTQFVLLLAAFSPSIDVPLAFLGIATVFFVKFLVPPVALYDLGIREGAAVMVLGTLGFPEAAAFNAALLLFGINLFGPALLGAPFVVRLRPFRREAPRAVSAPSPSTSR